MALNDTYHLLAYNVKATSSEFFEFRWELRLANTTKKETKYYIYTYLRWIKGTGGTSSYVKKGSCPVKNPNTGASESCVNMNPTTYVSGVTTLARMRHDWTITYTIDKAKPITKTFDEYETWLPDDRAKKGTVNSGHLHMKKNEWYQWGPPKTGTWKNDGSSHTIKVSMHCKEFGYPWDCPKKGVSSQKTITMPQYKITPSKPKATIKGKWYNYTVAWAAVANASKYKLQRRINDGSWKDVTSYDTKRTYAPSDYFAYVPGTKVYYRVIAKSSTGDTATGDASPAIRIAGGVKIKVNGVWKSGTVYIRVSGVWRKAHYVETKQNNSWKISAY